MKPIIVAAAMGFHAVLPHPHVMRAPLPYYDYAPMAAPSAPDITVTQPSEPEDQITDPGWRWCYDKDYVAHHVFGACP